MRNYRLHWSALFAAALIATVSACGGGDSNTSTVTAGDGTLIGTISIGPICPVESIPPRPECQPTPAVYAAHPVSVYEVNPAAACAPIGCNKGRLVTTLIPDAQGKFSTSFPANRYIIDVAHQSIGAVQGAPAEIIIVAGQTTTADISIDTGIR
jgi:hypothetical protein